MTTLAAILTEAIRLGIELWVHNGNLRYLPRDKMTVDLADRIRSHKPQLLAALSAGSIETVSEVAEGAPDIAPPDWSRWDPHTRDAFDERLAICLESGDVPEAVAVRIATIETRRMHCGLEDAPPDGLIDAVLDIFGDELEQIEPE